MKSPESGGEKPKAGKQEKRSEADLSEVTTEAFAMKAPDPEPSEATTASR